MEKIFEQSIHIPFSKKDLESLKRRARRERKSVAELIRQAVHITYSPADIDEKKKAYEFLSKQSSLKVEAWKKMKKDLLNRYE